MTIVLDYEDVRAYYGAALIIDGVSFDVLEGECFALLGQNGVGKTTAINALYSIARVQGGSISVAGRPLTGRPAHEVGRAGAALVPQGRWLVPSLTVEENLVIGQATGRKGRWTLATVMAMFPELEERRRNLGSNLSGGQQQMVAIGRALLSNPLVLILDEPSEGLAPVVIDRLSDVLAALREEGTSMLLVEQRLDLVKRLADRFAVLAKGQVTVRGRIRETSDEQLRDLLRV